MPAHITSDTQPISADQVREVEQRLGVTLPDDYRAFLLAHNGGRPAPGWVRYGADDTEAAEITYFYSAADVEAETTNLREHRVPNYYLLIGAVFDEECLVLSFAKKKPGAVYWNASNDNFDRDNFTQLADSFGELLAKLDYLESTKPWMKLIDENDLPGLTAWLGSGGSARAADEDITGISALEHAAFSGRLEMVSVLLARGARPGSAFLYSVQAGQRDVARLLVSRGVKKDHAAEALLHDWVHNDPVLVAALTGKPPPSP